MRDFLRFSDRAALCAMNDDGWWLLPLRPLVRGNYQRNYDVLKLAAGPLVKWEDTVGADLPSSLERVYALNNR
jgi:hypothetical protein